MRATKRREASTWSPSAASTARSATPTKRRPGRTTRCAPRSRPSARLGRGTVRRVSLPPRVPRAEGRLLPGQRTSCACRFWLSSPLRRRRASLLCRKGFSASPSSTYGSSTPPRPRRSWTSTSSSIPSPLAAPEPFGDNRRREHSPAAALLAAAAIASPPPGPPPNAAAVVDLSGESLSVAYEGQNVLTASVKGAAGVGVTRLVHEEGGRLEQVILLEARGKGAAVVNLRGEIAASGESFPCEVDRRRAGLDVVRHRSGLSRSRVNRAVYDRARDWVSWARTPTICTSTCPAASGS